MWDEETRRFRTDRTTRLTSAALLEIAHAQPPAHCGEEGIEVDHNGQTYSMRDLSLVANTTTFDKDALAHIYAFARTLNANLEHRLTTVPQPNFGPNDKRAFVTWTSLYTSPTLSHERALLDELIGTCLDGLARDADLTSLWDPRNVSIPLTDPVVLYDEEISSFVYTSANDRRSLRWVPQGVGELVSLLPGAAYGVQNIPPLMRSFPSDLRYYLRGVEDALKDTSARAGSLYYPYCAIPMLPTLQKVM